MQHICDKSAYRVFIHWCSPREDQSKITNRGSNTGFGVWDLPQKSPTKAKVGTKLRLLWYHFYKFLGLLVVIFIKMPQNLQKAKKGFKK